MRNETLTQIKYIAFMLYAPFVALIEFTELNKLTIICLTLLIVIDLITGVIKTIRVNKKPTSTRLANGVFSKLVLLFIPVSVALAVKGLGLNFVVLLDTTLAILMLSELYSIVANIYTIRTKEEVPEFDAVSAILKVIRHKINTFLGDK